MLDTVFTAELAAKIEEELDEYGLDPIDGECLLAGAADGRYILLEEGHYGTTWLSAHDSPEAAGAYSLNQEYAEDWAAAVLIDRETLASSTPATIAWK